MTRRIITALLSDGRVRTAYLGLVSMPVPLPAPLVERTGQRRALRVIEVVTGGPADPAGLRAGDLVLSAGRRPVADAQSLQRLCSVTRSGCGCRSPSCATTPWSM